jgi:hypothetical protein
MQPTREHDVRLSRRNGGFLFARFTNGARSGRFFIPKRKSA